MDNQVNKGFTLIELMVTISIVGIMAAIAVPNFTTFIQNSRIVAQANDLVTSLNYARSEAVKRWQGITVCPGTAAGCSNSANWSNGWVVFVDNDANGVPDNAASVLRVKAETLEGGNTLNGNVNSFNFNSRGSSSVADTINLCDSRGTAEGRAIVVTAIGRIKSSKPATVCP